MNIEDGIDLIINEIGKLKRQLLTFIKTLPTEEERNKFYIALDELNAKLDELIVRI